MKKALMSVLLSVLLLVSGCADAGEGVPEGGEVLTVVATTYPVYLFTTALTQGVEGVEVLQLVNQQTSCLHDYTLTVTDMKTIEKADLIVMNGAGLEDFMADALAASDAATVDCSEGITLLSAQGHEGHEHETEYDPHIWMTEENAAQMMRSIGSALYGLDPEHGEAYYQNYETACASLTVDPETLSRLKGKQLITFHDGFQYFAQAAGMTILKSIEEEEGSETSAQEIKEIVALIREYHIPAIFTEKNGSDATARAIARETGAAVYPLDMIMSGDGTGIEPYVDAMNQNFATILEALG